MPEAMSESPEQYLLLHTAANKGRNRVSASSLSSPKTLESQGNSGWKGSLDCPQSKTGPALRSDMVDHGFILSGPQNLQGRRLHNLSGQPGVRCSTVIMEDKVLLPARYQHEGCSIQSIKASRR